MATYIIVPYMTNSLTVSTSFLLLLIESRETAGPEDCGGVCGAEAPCGGMVRVI
jgi:hypothetical protein